MDKLNNPFTEFIAQYEKDPVRMVREVFGEEPYVDQIELLEAYARRERRISKRSGHGVGKTTGDAWILCHHLLTRFPQKSVCTAPTTAQLMDALAAETKAWLQKLPSGLFKLLEIKSDRIELKGAPNESFISFRTSRPETPEVLAGIHSENVLLIADEASGIPEPVFEAAAGSMSGFGATTILTGNPVRSSGLFYDTFHKLRDQWVTMHVSCIDHENVAPDFIEDMRRRYGERSNAFRVRVLGEFPLADDDTVIPFELMEAALKRDVSPINVRPLWGLDVARFGMDDSALAKRKGNVLQEPVKRWHGVDLMQTVGKVKAEYDATLNDNKPEWILVDSIGLGAGAVDRLNELGLPVRGINVSESPSVGEQYRNLRAELYFKMREWFSKRDSNLAGDEALGAQLVAIKYKFTSNGKTQLESKDEMKNRGLSSPDLGDAFALTFAQDATAASGNYGVATSWKNPLRRILKGIV